MFEEFEFVCDIVSDAVPENVDDKQPNNFPFFTISRDAD